MNPRQSMRILLVKTSSLGDVVHNLPVVTDICQAFPDAQIDWVVEEGFAELPRLHHGVNRVIPVALRRWRKNLLSASTWREMRIFRQAIQATDYDLVLDTQGLIKSSLLARLAHGPRSGYGRQSAREPMASHWYERCFDVARDLHAVVRNRQLAALALDYSVPEVLDYGLTTHPFTTHDTPTAILLTATSRDDKLWPEQDWIALGQDLARRGLRCLLPGGSAIERERATRLAASIPGAVALPRKNLTELAELLAAATIVIGVDTGLVHLAAALDRPTIAIFCASNPGLTGVLAGGQNTGKAVNLGRLGEPPKLHQVLAAVEQLL
jgi:heptosyltransferase-1